MRRTNLKIETLEDYRLRQVVGGGTEEREESRTRAEAELLNSATSLRDYDQLRRVQDRLVFAPDVAPGETTLRDYVRERNAEEMGSPSYKDFSKTRETSAAGQPENVKLSEYVRARNTGREK